MVGSHPLGALDATFLHLESQRTPMHMGSVAIFEGGPLCDTHGRVRIEKLRADVEERLDLVPKLRRRVRFAFFGEAAPVWVDDPDFDLTAHMRVVALPAPGTMDQLAALSAEILAVPLDLGAPLWEMSFVEGLAGGRVALIEKLHHALADGLAGVELATVLLDTTRHPRHPHVDARPWRPQPAPRALSLAVRDMTGRGATLVHGARMALRSLVRPRATARAAGRLADALSTLATPRLIAPRSSINVPIGQARRVAFVRVSLDHIVAVERRHDVTVNDVVLAAVAGGLRRMLMARGDDVDGGELQVLVPVGAPHDGDHGLGNRVSAMLARLPVGVEDPVDRLRAVAASVAHAKVHHQAVVGQALLAVLEPVPQPVLAAAARAVHHQTVVNLVVTNVPGPRFPLYAHGAKMLEAYPIVPLAGNLSLGVAALSYDGQMHIGLYADRDACPDLERLADGIRRSFEELVPGTSPAPGHRTEAATGPAGPGPRPGTRPASARTRPRPGTVAEGAR
jgi:diacylglycerol O-acyltransferase / wax synthase